LKKNSFTIKKMAKNNYIVNAYTDLDRLKTTT